MRIDEEAISSRLPYLHAMCDALVRPADSLSADLYLHRIAASCVVDQQVVATLQATAASGYRAVIEESVAELSQSPETRDQVQELASCLRDTYTYSGMEALVQQLIRLLAPMRNAASAKLLAQLVNIDLALRTEWRAATETLCLRRNQSAEPFGSAEPDVQKRLTEFFRQRFAETHALEIASIKLIGGGFSKQTWIVDFHGNTALPDSVVIRHDLPSLQGGTVTLADEWRVLSVLYNAGVAVPQPLAIEEAGKILPGSFIVMNRIDGVNVGDGSDARAGSAALGLDLAIKVAQLHQVPPVLFGDELPGARMDNRTRVSSLFEKYEAEWRRTGRASAALELAFAWLKEHLHVIGERRSLVHGDIGFHNFLVKDDEVVAFLDWEQVSVGSPAQDLGYVQDFAVQLTDWSSFTRAYADAGGIVPSAAEIELFSLWATVWRTVITLGCKVAFESGALTGVPYAYISAYLMQRENELLAKKLKRLVY